MRELKSNKGITLVALIITIIVLLILAVVAIRAVQGDGMIDHAKNARNENAEAQDKEALMLALNEWKIVGNTTSSKTFQEFMEEKFGAEKVQAGSSENEVIVTLENGNQYKVKVDGTIEATKGISISKASLTLILASEETKTAELIAKISGIQGEISWSIPEADASKVTLSATTGEKITVTGVAEGNTTITVSCGGYSKTCEVTVMEKLDHSEVVVPTIAKEEIFANNPNIKEVREGNIPIPVGFDYVKGDHIGGAVITDGTNEFVWVPVTSNIASYGLNTSNSREPDVITGVAPSETVDSASGTSYDAVEANLTRAGCTEDLNDDKKVDAYDFKKQLTNEFNRMAASVNKYHGYYVGRYEMSYDASGNAQSKKNETSRYANWYGLYAKAKSYQKASIVSSMIWGSQYNAMMSWMKGNGIDVNKNTPTDLSIGLTSRNTTRVTGSVSKDKLSNVFDLLGNSYECTLEAKGPNNRVERGGFYGNVLHSPSYSGSIDPTVMINSNGSRLALYIK